LPRKRAKVEEVYRKGAEAASDWNYKTLEAIGVFDNIFTVLIVLSFSGSQSDR
jgi:hypothetical protein